MIMKDIYNSHPMFSVIIPAYNSEEFIHKCVDSVLGQTCADFELIIVDDGSKDSTPEICNEYAKKDRRVKVIHKENGGHTSARNEGLKLSVGKYILFLDSDDWFSLHTLEMCKRQIVSHNSDVIVFRMIKSTSTEPFFVMLDDGYYETGSSESVIRKNLLMSSDGKFIFPKSLSAKCFKRQFILESQFSVPKEILIGEDGAAFIGAMLKARSVSVIASNEMACYNCLVRSNSVSHTADRNAFKRLAALIKYYLRVFEGFPDLSEQLERDIVAQLYTASLFVMRSGCGRSELNAGLSEVLNDPVASKALRKAKFSLNGYKFIIKKFILRYRLWGLARLLDK